MFINKAKGLHI